MSVKSNSAAGAGASSSSALAASQIEPDKAGDSPLAPLVLAFKQVRFRWPGQDFDTLDIPDFSLAAGEHCFLAGPSGSGKSTLLSLAAGILRPSSGQVLVQGQDLARLRGSACDVLRGEQIGFIFQQFNLVPYLSILENVLIPCRLAPVRAARAADQGESLELAAKDLLLRLDLPQNLWARPVMRLSVGQQQRVAAARALLGRPPLLIADEPTSALDADRRSSFLSLLRREAEAAGSALLFVSHDAALAQDFPRRENLTQLNCASLELAL